MKTTTINKFRKALTGILVIGAGFLISPVYGQAPQAIKYQGVARDNVGNELTFQKLGLRLSIVANSATGTEVYVETHVDTTNEFGLFNVELGNGTTTDDFTAIDWGSTTHYLKVEMDETGDTNYQEMGTSQLLAVPYALYADSAGAAPGSAPQTLTFAGGSLSISGGNTVTLPDSVNDFDADTLNEIQNLILAGSELWITGGDTVTLPDNVDDLDADTLNEIQSLTLVGNDLSITGGNTVTLPDSNDADADSTNEIQTLTLSGNDLSITGGNTVTLSSTAPSDTSLYADSADFTNTAGYAWYADMAGYADTATYAWSAASSDTANFAYDADTANYAWSALNADTANIAFAAGFANLAQNANYADTANFAYYADTANAAWVAALADSANFAYDADTAKYADTAGYAFGPWGQSGTDIFYTPGRVGIGTGTPAAQLHVKQVGTSLSAGIRLETSLGTGEDWYLYMNGTDDLNISNDGSNFLTIWKDLGRVGIGTTAPYAQLHVSTTGDPALFERTGSSHDNRLKISMTNQALSGASNTTADQTINLVASGAPGHTGDMAFSANADNTNTGDIQMIITNAGNVGIGNTAPTSLLQVNRQSFSAGADNGILQVYHGGNNGSSIRAMSSSSAMGGPSAGPNVYAMAKIAGYENNATGSLTNFGVWGHVTSNGSGGWGVLASNGLSETSPDHWVGLAGPNQVSVFRGGKISLTEASGPMAAPSNTSYWKDGNGIFMDLDHANSPGLLGIGTDGDFGGDIMYNYFRNASDQRIIASDSAGWSGIRFSTDGDISLMADYNATAAQYDSVGQPDTRLFIDGATGKVGIGTTEPMHRMTIFGEQFSSSDGPNLSFVTTQDSFPTMELFNWGHREQWLLFNSYYDGSFKSGSSDGNFAIHSSLYTSTPRLQFGYADGITGGSNVSFTTVMTIEGPNIGIGDTSPDGRLEVRQTGTDDIFNLYDGSTNVFTVEDGGYVGIGTTDPFYPLHMEGVTTNSMVYVDNEALGGGVGISARVTTTATSIGTRYGVRGYAYYGQSSNYGLYGYGFGGTTSYGVFALAGGATTNWALYASGDSYTSAGAWTPSDERLKTNISAFEGALSKIEQLPVKTYHFNTEKFPTMNFSSRKQYGIMAQDLKKVFPEIVLEADHPIPGEDGELTEENTVEIKAVNYVQLIPVLVKAVQEQQVIIESQKNELDTLKAEMSEMKSAVRACSPKNK